jgi:thiol:disulfide interchange protein DsbC
MKIIKLAITALLVAFTAIAFADTSPSTPEATVKQLVEQHMHDGTKIDSVTKTNFSGLYEVRTGGDIMYTDAQGKYLIVGGHVLDVETHKDYTKERIDEISKINFSDLPLESSIKMVKGNGKRVIAVFEDPNCGYCKRLRHTLAGMDNVTVYTFMYNILAPDSSVKSKDVWCTKDRLKAWDDWMLNGKAPAAAAATCLTNPNDKVLALGQKLRITGTPTIFFADGTRIPGAVEAAGLEEKWASIK